MLYGFSFFFNNFSSAYHCVLCVWLSGLEDGGCQSESLVRQGQWSGHEPSWD